MPFNLGPVELGLILLIVAMLFGVGKLPEVFGSIGKGVREFRKESGIDEGKGTAGSTAATPQVLPPQAPVAQLPMTQGQPAVPVAPVAPAADTVSTAAPANNEHALG